jgi:hypothetical protein
MKLLLKKGADSEVGLIAIDVVTFVYLSVNIPMK